MSFVPQIGSCPPVQGKSQSIAEIWRKCALHCTDKKLLIALLNPTVKISRASETLTTTCWVTTSRCTIQLKTNFHSVWCPNAYLLFQLSRGIQKKRFCLVADRPPRRLKTESVQIFCVKALFLVPIVWILMENNLIVGRTWHRRQPLG